MKDPDPDTLDLIERYARERVLQALAGHEDRAMMHRGNARDILRELTQELGISHENFWRGE